MKSNVPPNETTTVIAEAYITARIEKKPCLESDFRNRLKTSGKKQEQIDELLVKMYDEYEKEHFQQRQGPNPRMLIFLGVVIFSACSIITILSFMGLLMSGYGFVFLIGGTATGFITILKGLDQIKMKKHRQQIRKLRWELYD